MRYWIQLINSLNSIYSYKFMLKCFVHLSTKLPRTKRVSQDTLSPIGQVYRHIAQLLQIRRHCVPFFGPLSFVLTAAPVSSRQLGENHVKLYKLGHGRVWTSTLEERQPCYRDVRVWSSPARGLELILPLPLLSTETAQSKTVKDIWGQKQESRNLTGERVWGAFVATFSQDNGTVNRCSYHSPLDGSKTPLRHVIGSPPSVSG